MINQTDLEIIQDAIEDEDEEHPRSIALFAMVEQIESYPDLEVVFISSDGVPGEDDDDTWTFDIGLRKPTPQAIASIEFLVLLRGEAGRLGIDVGIDCGAYEIIRISEGHGPCCALFFRMTLRESCGPAMTELLKDARSRRFLLPGTLSHSKTSSRYHA